MSSLIGDNNSAIQLNGGNLHCVDTSYGNSAAAGQVTPLEVIWYNAPGHAWTVGQKALATEWLNNVSQSPWWGFKRDYLTPSGDTPSGVALDMSVDDPETEGTAGFICGGGGTAQTVISNAISGATLPANPNAIYLLMPSYSDIVPSGGCGGYHFLVTVGGVTYPYAMVTRPTATPFGATSPNGDVLFDNEIEILGHELSETLTFGCKDGSFPGGEVGDLCAGDQSSLWFFSHAYLTGGGVPANLHLGADDFWAQDIWSREQGGHCVNGQTPAELSNLVPCLTASSCPWSKACVNGHCAIPTCSDGILNQDESDTDCGSTCGMTLNGGTNLYGGNCATGKKCVTRWDCTSTVCTAGVCL